MRDKRSGKQRSISHCLGQIQSGYYWGAEISGTVTKAPINVAAVLVSMIVIITTGSGTCL